MREYLSGGFSPIPYEGFKAIRAESNSDFTAWGISDHEDPNIIILTTISADGLKLITILDKKSQDLAMVAKVADFMETMAPFANTSVEKRDAWFKMHDLSDKRTWSGTSTGFPVAWFVGGITYDENHGRWLDQNEQSITAQYDDYHYRWVDNAFNSFMAGITGDLQSYPFTRLAYLDQSEAKGDDPSELAKCVWRDDLGNVLVQFDPGAGDPRDGNWIRVDAQAPLTPGNQVNFSHFRVAPDLGFKVQINQVRLTANKDTKFPGVLSYKVRSYYPPAGDVITVRNWKYRTLKLFIEGSNMNPGLVKIDEEGDMVTVGYDYRASISPVLDSRAMQHIEISLAGNQRMTMTDGTSASFVAKKIRSF